MTEEQIALSKRAVACKKWRWLPGMLTTCDLRVVDGGDEYVIGHRSGPTKDGGGWYDGEAEGLLPDLTDPATLGCLLALVREAWGESRICVVPMSGHKWGVAIPNVLRESPRFKGTTEAEAIIGALEAAP